MSKAQTDIRTTSYDVMAARPHGYQGEIDDVIAQIRDEDVGYRGPRAVQLRRHLSRLELLHYLGVDKIASNGPSVEMDENPRYGVDEPAPGPSFWSLEYALKNFPGSFMYPGSQT